MKKSCKEIRDSLPLYVDNMTTQIESSIIKEHLDTCAECRQEYNFLKSIMSTAATLPLIKPTEGFSDKLHLKLVEEKNKNRKKLLSKIQKVSAAVLTSAAVIAISVVSLNVLDEKKLIDEPNPMIETTPQDIQTGNSETTLSEDDSSTEQNESPSPDDKQTNELAESESSATPTDSSKNTDANSGGDSQNKNSRRTTTPSRGDAHHDKSPEQTTSPEKSSLTSSTPSALSNDNIAPASSAEESQTVSSASFSATPSRSIGEDSPKSSGGGSGNKVSARTVVPPKVKITVNVNVKDSDLSLAKQMLSGYTYSNGAYVLSSSEYHQVGAKLDALGATSSITREDKTSAYADLQMRLNNATGSKATNIRIQMNNIDNEVSKTYIVLN